MWFLYLRQNMESQCIYCVLSTLCGLGYFTVYCSNTHDYYYDTIHMGFVRCSSFTWACRAASAVAISLCNWRRPPRICVFQSTQLVNSSKAFIERHIMPYSGLVSWFEIHPSGWCLNGANMTNSTASVPRMMSIPHNHLASTPSSS